MLYCKSGGNKSAKSWCIAMLEEKLGITYRIC